MKKISLLLSFVCLLAQFALGQNKMIVDIEPGLTHFNGHGEIITSLKKLPNNIIDSAKLKLNQFMGDFSADALFYYGQTVDLEAYNKNIESVKINRFIPKYDLVFILKNISMGIKSLPIELRMNENGKLLKLTWPRKGYTKKEIFVPLDSVRRAALTEAERLGFNLSDYEVKFEYDYVDQKFLWVFLFPFRNQNPYAKKYKILKVNWADVTDLKESDLLRTVVN